MTRAPAFRRRMAVLFLAMGMLGSGGLAAAIPAAADVLCTSGVRTLSNPGDRVYPDQGNGGYTSLHTDLFINYDTPTNMFLPGTHADLQIQATQCLSDFSFDFERTAMSGSAAGPNMAVNSVLVNGAPATFDFRQPTYPGNPNGPDDPDPLAHAISNVNPVSTTTNPNPPACSPQVSGSSQNGQQCPANKLVITPDVAIAQGEVITVTVNYTGRPGVHNDGDGSTEGWFRVNTIAAPNDGSFVTTEPIGTQAWMPLNNHPTAKVTYDIYDTVPIGKTAIAAGELVGATPPTGGVAAFAPMSPTAVNPPDATFPGGSWLWHWHSPEKVASYLITNTIGSYDLVARTSAITGIQYYQAMASALTPARKTAIKAALDIQEDITQFQTQFNGPFPFSTNGAIVALPNAGFEEEMQTKITFGNGASNTPGAGVFNHENMHQWFGDNVAEGGFRLTFWKEGWATVGEYLNTARNAANAAGGLGTAAGQTAFDNSLVAQFNSNYALTNAATWTVAPSNPTVGNLFTTANTYRRPGTAYLALRQILDASASRGASDRWIGAMKEIQSVYGGKSITEQQLEDVFHGLLPNQSEDCHTKLNTFFTQWFDMAYPTPNNATNKPQITGPGINGPDHFYDDTSACTRADQTISFGALANKFFDDPDFTLSATSDSGLPVTFAASGQCTVTGTNVDITGLGSCTITASQAGDGVFKPAVDVPQTFQITKHPQTITFAQIDPKAYLDADFGITATATSGLPVSLVAVGDCTIDSLTSPANVHIVQSGSCTITASQAGNANYNPAADVPNTFAISEAQIAALSPVHTWVSLKNSDDTGTSFDVKVELLKNGTTIETGLLRCVTGIPRAVAGKVIDVPWTFAAATVDKGDILSLKVSTRIGTNSNDTKCAGHNGAAGLRLYYDTAAQASRLGATIGSVPVAFTEYLRSDGKVCNNAESTGVTSRTLDGGAPAATPAAKCKDSTSVNFGSGNPYKEIGTWGTVSYWIMP